MRRWLPVLLALVPFGLAGCTLGQDAETTTATLAPSTALPPSAAATPSVTQPESPATEATGHQCDSAFAAEAKSLAAEWGLVVTSKGEVDEATYVVEFADAANKLFDGIEDFECGTATVATAASVNFEASLLALAFRGLNAPSEPAGDQHGKVVREGNALLRHLAVMDTRFIALECKDRISESEACTPPT